MHLCLSTTGAVQHNEETFWQKQNICYFRQTVLVSVFLQTFCYGHSLHAVLSESDHKGVLFKKSCHFLGPKYGIESPLRKMGMSCSTKLTRKTMRQSGKHCGRAGLQARGRDRTSSGCKRTTTLSSTTANRGFSGKLAQLVRVNRVAIQWNRGFYSHFYLSVCVI